MTAYSYNKQQKLSTHVDIATLCRVVLALVLLFHLSTHVDIARAFYQVVVTFSSKHWLAFIFMNFIIFVLSFLSSQKQMEPPYVIYHDNVGSHMNVRPVDVGDDSPPGEEHKEEIFVDKHIVSVENAAGEILSVCSDDSSESFEWSHHGLELRRLERRMSKEVVITMREPPWKSMDDMRNEEFTFSMEAFIAERNEVMMEENIHDEEGLPLF